MLHIPDPDPSRAASIGTTFSPISSPLRSSTLIKSSSRLNTQASIFPQNESIKSIKNPAFEFTSPDRVRNNYSKQASTTTPTINKSVSFPKNNNDLFTSFSDKTFNICNILEIRGHILIIDVWTESGKVTKLVTIENVHLFPAGFAEANNCKFYIPEDLKRFCREEEEDQSRSGECLPPLQPAKG